MIDDKKIEEAARYYCNNRYPASQDAPFIAEGFRLGAKWAINEFLKNLWHQKDEEPEGYDEWILLHYSAFNYYSLSQVKEFKYWKEFVERAPIENWLYIDDLFQKEGGEHD